MIKLEPGEQIVAEVRRHWFILLAQVLSILFMAVMPLVAYALARTFLPVDDILQKISGATLALIYTLWLVVVWVMLFAAWTHYYLDVWIVTTKRLVDFEFKSFFRYETSSMRLDRIQDVTVEVDGLWANVLNFGDLKVETAGEMSNTFRILSASHPEQVKQIIFQHHNAAMEARPKIQ